jgi:glycosyltransferase involved in cell wall biosynthesis
MKVAIPQPRTSYYVGGAEKISLRIAQELSTQDFEVFYITADTEGLSSDSHLYTNAKSHTPDVEFIEQKLPEKYHFLYSQSAGENKSERYTESLVFNHSIYETLTDIKPDVVLSFFLYDSLFPPPNCLNLVYLLGTPEQKTDLHKGLFGVYDGSISISKSVKNWWGEDFLAETGKTTVLYPGVDLPTSATNPFINDKNIVFAGRLIERKGADTLLKAFKLLIENGYSYNLWILGDGPHRPVIEKLVTDLGIEQYVMMPGSVNNPTDYFSFSDFTVFPSYRGDGMMGTVLEAMASSAAVISTKNSGSEEVIEDGVNGVIAEPGDEHRLAEDMKYLIEHEDCKNQLGKAAKEFVENKFSWNDHAHNLCNFINEVNNDGKK